MGVAVVAEHRVSIRHEPIGPFATRAEHVSLGNMTLQFATGTARRYDRPAARLRVDGIDFLGVSLTIDGTIEGRAGDEPFRAGPGAFLMLDLAQRSAFTFSEASGVQMAIPRALAERHLGSIATLHGTVVDAERAAFLCDYLDRLHKELPGLTVAQGPGLSRVILELLAIALNRGEAVAPPARPGVSAARLAAEATIDAHLASSRLTAAMICAKLKINRTTLFRLFKGDGGFQAYARRLRLEHVRQSLGDPGNRNTITALAERWGFADGPHLSRLFRREFGYPPSEYRRQVFRNAPPR